MSRRRGDAARRHAKRLKAAIVDNGGELEGRQEWFREAGLTLGQGNVGWGEVMRTDSGDDGTLVSIRRGPQPALYRKSFDPVEQDRVRLRYDLTAHRQEQLAFANARACLEQVDKFSDPDRWHELMSEQERAEEAMGALERKVTRKARQLGWSGAQVEALFADVPEEARA